MSEKGRKKTKKQPASVRAVLTGVKTRLDSSHKWITSGSQHVTTLFRNAWRLSQGVSFYNLDRWNDKSRFAHYPPKCVVCGRPWRPGQPSYIEVFGRIVVVERAERHVISPLIIREDPATVPGDRSITKDGKAAVYLGIPYQSFEDTDDYKMGDIFKHPEIVWFCEALNVIGPTGWLDDHIRRVCRYHGDHWGWVTDVTFGYPVTMYPPQEIRLKSPTWHWTNIKHWAATIWRFPGHLVAQTGLVWRVRQLFHRKRENEPNPRKNGGQP